MQSINIHQAKTHLSMLLSQVISGKEIIISKAGKPIAKLVPFQPPPKARMLGKYQGLIKISEDFDAPLAEIEAFHQ
jgi:prevent-host-death family protein